MGGPMDEHTTHLHCDSTEFCPTANFRDLLAVSMYQLDESTKTRNGRVQLYRLEHGVQSSKLVAAAHLECSGVFDLKWSPSSDATSPLAATALADGSISFLQVQSSRGEDLNAVATAQGAAGEGMAVSCAWDPHCSDRVLASSSDGSLSTVTMRESEASVASSWHAHDYEAWIVTCDQHMPDVAYSGADDCKFKGWDVRQPDAPTFVNSRAHGAGVCCIHSHPTRPHCCATGSYDEYVRLWDMRNTCAPVSTSKVSVGGGVWRFKWHPTNPDLALVACMHNGFAVLSSSSPSDLTVHEEYAHQKTLGYGADWWYGGEGREGDLAATCSFYDRSLHLWAPQPGVAT